MHFDHPPFSFPQPLLEPPFYTFNILFSLLSLSNQCCPYMHGYRATQWHSGAMHERGHTAKENLYSHLWLPLIADSSHKG